VFQFEGRDQILIEHNLFPEVYPFMHLDPSFFFFWEELPTAWFLSPSTLSPFLFLHCIGLFVPMSLTWLPQQILAGKRRREKKDQKLQSQTKLSPNLTETFIPRGINSAFCSKKLPQITELTLHLG
jgi:hypothetical protein